MTTVSPEIGTEERDGEPVSLLDGLLDMAAPIAIPAIVLTLVLAWVIAVDVV